MRNERSSVDGERGASLIETLVAVRPPRRRSWSVSSLRWPTSIRTSDYHRKRTEVESVLVSAAERIKETAAVACATHRRLGRPTSTAARQAATAEGWGGSTVRIVSIQYWNGTTYGSTCYDNATNALRLQRIKLEVVHPSGDVQKQLELVKGVLD